ncbi:MAG: hypothetical protein GX208_03635 [Firmicutes bacterium]|mgnify:CR=1 FL=1|nr:hypothetical protein [Bacillota bacterium]
MFLKLVLFYIPATFVTHYGILGLLKLNFEVKKLAVYSFIFGIITMLVRDLFQLTGLHVIILSVCSIVLLMYFFNFSMVKSVTIRAFLLLTLTIGEATVATYFFNLFGITLEQSLNNPFYHILLGWLGHVVSLTMVIYVLIRDNILTRERGSVFGQKA